MIKLKITEDLVSTYKCYDLPHGNNNIIKLSTKLKRVLWHFWEGFMKEAMCKGDERVKGRGLWK